MTTSAKEQFDSALHTLACKYAKPLPDGTLIKREMVQNGEFRAYKAGYRACLNSTVVRELESVCLEINEYLKLNKIYNDSQGHTRCLEFVAATQALSNLNSIKGEMK